MIWAMSIPRVWVKDVFYDIHLKGESIYCSSRQYMETDLSYSQVSIGCPEKMEPITKISHIPASRWALSCSLCKECTGTCIQVSN